MKTRRMLSATAFLALASMNVYAQKSISDGASALNSLTSDMEAYIDPVTTVVYVVAAVVGLVGALRVFINWQNGKENVMANATGWLGACLFLLIANTVLRAMFI
ncbi:DUF4134 family protein [Runella limosa]|uniref:DUF4134 family protein n=1 Tax=Runella limosa TaxID=370978 RepID=UPI000565EF5F|nr:DUF4134 family protein [Runella limosa]